jgi:hypothetical protein
MTLGQLYDNLAWGLGGRSMASEKDQDGHTVLFAESTCGGCKLTISRYSSTVSRYKVNSDKTPVRNVEKSFSVEHWSADRCLPLLRDLIKGLEPLFGLEPTK